MWWEGFVWCHDSWILGYPKYWCASNCIKLESFSGSSADGTDFYYTVEPNNTGDMRKAYITVKGSNAADKITLKFVQ